MIATPQDLRHTVRTAVRQPGMTLVIVLTLAVGIGSNIGIFTYLLEMYWTQVRAPDPERLFFVETGTEQKPRGRASYLDTLEYHTALADLGELSPWRIFGATLVVEGGEGDVGTALFNVGSAVSPPHFKLFGARMPLGRDFLPEDHQPDGPAVAVIDHFFWCRHLAADPEVLGRVIRINGVSFTIVGVTPRGFENTGLPHSAYIPVARLDDVLPTPVLADRGDHRFVSLLRLKPDVRPPEAKARLAVLAIKPFYIVMPVGLAHFLEGNVWVRYDVRVMVFALSVSVLTGCLFGLAPILHAVRTDLVSGLKGSATMARPGRRFGARQLLVVSQVALAVLLLLGAGLLARSLVLPRQPGESFRVDRITIGRDYFSTFEIGEVRGRQFDGGDRAGGTGAVIVNGAFVRRFLPEVEPLGQEIRLPDLEIESGEDRLVVVGVAPDYHHGSRRDELAPLVYLPLSQHLGSAWLVAVARTIGPPQVALQEIRETLATAHPDLALTDLGTYDRQIALDLHRQRLQNTLAGWLSLFGLGLACLGIYSAMSCSVNTRRHELGIRQALGARSRDLVRLVLGEASRMVAAGILIGMAAALVLTRMMSSLLYGIAPHDPVAFLTLPLLLAAVGLVAAWLPAWRAGQVDPKVALQEE